MSSMTTLRLLLATLAVVLLSCSPAAALAYDPYTPLLLDPYLTDPTTQAEGRALSLVTSFPPVYSPSSPTTEVPLPFTQHSGFFSVSDDCSLFFQLFSPKSNSSASSLPLIVILAGGPGIASTFWTLYGGITPLTFTPSPTPHLLYHTESWAEDAHILLIDAPIGVGYSTLCDPTRARSVREVTDHLVVLMTKFLTLYPAFTSQSIYIAGQSFAGRFASDVAAALASTSPIAGVIIESGITHTYLSFSRTCDAAYLQGLFNHTDRQQCNAALEQLKAAMERGDEAAAAGAIQSAMSMVATANGGSSYFDWQRRFTYANAGLMNNFLTSPAMRLALHVGNDTAYSVVVPYSLSDQASGQSLTTLDDVLSASGQGRVLYFAGNREQLLGMSTQQMLAATRYNQRTGWASTRPVALRQAGSNETRGLLKRDARLWHATLFDASHMSNIVQPALVRQLVADFIRSPASLTEEASPAIPSTPLTQSQKLLPPINRQDQPVREVVVSADDVSPAVYLTPYLSMSNGPALAQQAAAVTLPHPSVLTPNSTYSGYLTIDPVYSSHSFFWLLPSLDRNPSAPLILHLSGGPGISSMAMGFLYQHGPFAVNQSAADPLATHYRPDSFNERNSVLYVDNPIGTGFSYTDSALGFRNDSRRVADDLYELLRQFYLLFPAYRACRLYVHGVSYAGHFLPTLGYKIHQENMRRGAAEQVPFEGLFMASPWMDPASQTAEEDGFYQSIGRKDLNRTDVVVGCDPRGYCDVDYYNYVWGDVWEQEEAGIMRYLSHPSVVSALHAGPKGLSVRSSNNTVSRVLRNDPSVRVEVERLLASGSYHVVMYTAEYDVVCAASGVTNFIGSLDYTAATGWERSVPRVWWEQPDRPATQARQPPHTSPLQPWEPLPQGIWWASAPNFTLHHAMIRFAGHLIEQTHLYQAGQIITRVQSWPTLPKPPNGGGGGEGSSTGEADLSTGGGAGEGSSTGEGALSTGGGSGQGSSTAERSSTGEVVASTGEAEPKEKGSGFFGSGVGGALIGLLIMSVLIGAGACLQVRKERREKEEARMGSMSPAMSTGLLDDRQYTNSTL